PVVASSKTYNLSATFLGLNPYTTYYVQTAAYQNAISTWSAYTLLGSTRTLDTNPPAAANPSFNLVAITSLTVNWLDNSDPAGTSYYAQISTSSNFSPVVASSQTYNLSVTFTGLNPYATYYVQTAAYQNAPSTWSAFVSLGSTRTLDNSAPAPA